MSNPPPIPPAIRSAIRRLSILPQASVGQPRYEPILEGWLLPLTLTIANSSFFVPSTTEWLVHLEPGYPFGGIELFPAIEGGLKATFQHQERNKPVKPRGDWMTGKPCLDSPFRSSLFPIEARDPVGDNEERLLWHVQRTLVWLNSAANNTLVALGDPFELPKQPETKHPTKIVHDESSVSFEAWQPNDSFGKARFEPLSGLDNVWTATTFYREGSSTPIREWQGRRKSPLKDSVWGYWWLWSEPIVLLPWEAPRTWGDLRKIAKRLKIDVEGKLRVIARKHRGQTRIWVLIGYRAPKRIGEAPSEIHWQALHLPLEGKTGSTLRGFRANEEGWWQRDLVGPLAHQEEIVFLKTENWHQDRLLARGKVRTELAACSIAVIGVGALGSAIAELLARMGVRRLLLVDRDDVHAGNISRHVLTLNTAGHLKVDALKARLLSINPHIEVDAYRGSLPAERSEVSSLLDAYDVVLDCTAENEVLQQLADEWWSIPKHFVSLSLGYKAQRLFAFGCSTNQFPAKAFFRTMEPWLQEEAALWQNHGEVLEGTGCWSPLFPARYDDVLLAATTSVKLIEELVSAPKAKPQLVVFEQEHAGHFVGYRRRPSIETEVKE